MKNPRFNIYSGRTVLKKLFCLLLVLILLSGCAPNRQDGILTRTEFILDTFVTITLYDSRDEDALNSAIDLCRRFNYMFSRHSPLSELYRLNNAYGQPVAVSPELARLLEIAVYYSSLSGGLYDITIAPVVDLWFGNHDDDAPRTPPAPEEISQALSLVDYRNVIISGGTVTLKNGAMIDLGGIAKGFIADEIGQYLLGRGVTSAIINLGGDVFVVGGRPDGNPFRIGIREPFETLRDIMGVVSARNAAIFTSGVYERYFIHEDVRYHHILDARIGIPANTGLVSVTVVSELGVDGDALSILCFLLGVERGLELIESTDRAEALFIKDDGSIVMSSGMHEIFELAG